MVACAGGAEPLPEFAAQAVYIQAAAIGLDALEFITGFWPLAIPTSIFAVLPATKLCDLNPDDPGNLTWDLLSAGGQVALNPGPDSPVGTLAKWLWDKAIYNLFSEHCKCSVAGLTPPPPIIVVPPTGQPPYPVGPDTQPQLDRLEFNLTSNVDAMRQVYNGAQHVSSLVGDLYVRSVPALISDPITIADHVTGEGCVELPIFSNAISTPFSPYATHVEVVCHTIPPNTGIRGTLNPRLYGVGSLYFDANYSTNYSPNITGRQSIHYWREVMRLPARTQTYRICWRLMPGADVSLRIYGPNPDNVMYAMSSGAAYGWLPFHNEPHPPGFVDPPIYPNTPASRELPRGGAP